MDLIWAVDARSDGSGAMRWRGRRRLAGVNRKRDSGTVWLRFWDGKHAGVTANAVASSGRRLGDRNRARDSAWRSKSSGE